MNYRNHLNKLIALIAVFMLANCAGTSGGLGGGFGGGGFGLTSQNEGQELADDAEIGGSLFEAAVDSAGSGEQGVGGFSHSNERQNDSTGVHAKGGGSFSSEPVDIPVTIAKAIKPNVENILISIDESNVPPEPEEDGEVGHDEDEDLQDHPQGYTKKSHMIVIKGLAGAIPSPEENPFVYVFDPTTGKELFSKVAPDGSFEPIEMLYQLKSPLAVAVSDKAVIGEPVILRARNTRIYTWRTEQAAKPYAVGTFERSGVQSRIIVIKDISDVLSSRDKEGILNSKEDFPANGPLINRSPKTGESAESKPKTEEDNINQRVVTLRESSGAIRTIKDVRSANGATLFRYDNEILSQEEDQEVRTVYKTGRGETIKRWGVIQEKSAAGAGDPELSREATRAKTTNNLVAMVSNKSIRMVDATSSKVLIERAIEDVSDATFLLVEKEAPLERILTSLVREAK